MPYHHTPLSQRLGIRRFRSGAPDSQSVTRTAPAIAERPLDASARRIEPASAFCLGLGAASAP